MKATQLSIETLKRAQERFEETLEQMNVQEANTMPAPLIKSVTWLIWHTARELDYQISDLKSSDPLWISEGWNKKFSLKLPDDTPDWRHTPEEAKKVIIEDKQLLFDYLNASITLTIDYLSQVKETTFQDIVDTNWTPAVTRQDRIVSIIDDALMHSGQGIYTRRLVIGK
ncbi:hypothetical protein BH747_13175 [Enterococcus villorum]|uniref:DinB-like domain-containing protein n=1 Tax=Enterococcus villorum TaxID=112904 RepID=A0A1V8YKN5_9ENTE|nr:DinB family protein [Enterococcus villorum]OQO67989.1 hypothetical protein BH747_13175 [Enterococcus villorum]OQO73180.1 hypothetical protein BH744_10595 [Enterococcus villorum]